MMSSLQVVEFFHLVVLRALVAGSEAKNLIALKGGCNLRFYFGSVRYSEDMDLDVAVIARETLKNRIDRLLVAPAVVGPLKARGVAIADVAAPKQTNTTQRWKIGLEGGIGGSSRTKIEFSRRDALTGTAFEALDAQAVKGYGLPPFLATHYNVAAAIAQKVRALAGRVEPQARDVFDLHLLFARADASIIVLTASQKEWLTKAIERTVEISFDDYQSKVVSYLDPAQSELYAGLDNWEMMQEVVLARLEAQK